MGLPIRHAKAASPARSTARYARAAWGALALVLVLFVAGCEGGSGQRLTRWTLDAPGVTARSVDFPVHLDGELPHRLITYRLTTTVPLDARLVGHDVELVLPSLAAFASLRVNGQPARLTGERDPAAEYGGSMPRSWLLPAAATSSGEPITFELEVTHRSTRSAWLNVAPELAPAGETPPWIEHIRLLNELGGWFGLIALSQVGLTFLAVYFWDRRRRAYLWFAIQALTASYYPAYILGLPALVLGWAGQNLLLAQALAVAPIISVDFTADFFGLPRPHRAWRVALVVALASPILVTLKDPRFLDLSVASPIVGACVICSVVYQIVTGIRLLRTYPDRNTALFFLCSWIALGASSWVDVLAWVGGPDLLGGGRPACLGLGVFGIFQSMLLGRSHFRSLAEADGLNDRLRGQVRDLEERQGEIASLNDELRRQIGRRSSDILGALTRNPGSAHFEGVAGHVIEARYRILGTLGSGGMGAVYEVERLSDGKHLALKVALEVSGLALARLAREAQIATRVHHPNVVSIVDADVAEAGYAYLVMELVQGTSLADCDEGHDVSWKLDVLTQVLVGVEALHAQNIIHRDLKPSNILLARDQTSRPLVKITDFGISRWLEDEPRDARLIAREEATVEARFSNRPPARDDHGTGPTTRDRPGPPPREPQSTPQLTRAGAISGTPLYVAPELADGPEYLTPAVDIFSFGVVAYRLLTGKLPFREAPLDARLAGRSIPPPAPLGSMCHQVSPRLAEALDACLALTASERPTLERLVTVLRAEIQGTHPAPDAARAAGDAGALAPRS